MRLVIFCVAVLVVAPFPSAGSQVIPFGPRPAVRHLEPGDRVRVWASDAGGDHHVGTLRQLRRDTLVVDTLRLASASVTRLEVLRRQPWGAGRGAAVGAIIGVPLVVGIGLVTYDECEVREVTGFFSNCTFAASKKDVILGGAFIGAAGGALLGAILGTLVKSDRWVGVPLELLRVRVLPQAEGRLALGLSMGF